MDDDYFEKQLEKRKKEDDKRFEEMLKILDQIKQQLLPNRKEDNE